LITWQPYPEYKDSGLPWLVEVPTHWDIRKLKHISSVTLSNVDKQKNKGERSIHLCNYVDVYYNDYITADLEFMEATASPEEVGKFALREGDVIITKDSESWDDIAVAAYVSSDLEGILCGYHLALVRPNQRVIDGKYLFQSFCTSQINEQFTVEATGITRYGLAKHWIDNASFLVPPLPEQHAIAAFLDHHTAKIDTLIAEQRHLIELLQERRAALISHAVTKGLDRHIPMKDSDFPWLGKIPLHWETRPLWTVAYLQRGHDLPSQDRIQGEVPVVSSSGVSAYHAEAKAKGPGVVTGRYGTIGEVFYIEQDYWPLNTALYVRDFYGNRPRYIYYLLAILPFDAYSGKSAVPGIDRNDLHPLPVVCPPVAEQSAIVAYLDRETARIDALIAEIETGVAHLEEYRTTLISAAVTGKIDVRDALPADAPTQPRLTSP
jgi:type I restriction enzyme S subunit